MTMNDARKLAIDMGGTWLRIGYVRDGSVLEPSIERYPSPRTWEQFVELLNQKASRNISGAGIAVSGPVQDHARVLQAPNLPWLNGRAVRPEVESLLQVPTVVSNDMEAATEGEMARGVLQRYSWAIFDTISTGWGGNLILNGLRVDGEPGHANLSFQLPNRCGAGHQGCYESLYSGSALAKYIRKRMDSAGIEPTADVWGYFNAEFASGADWSVQLLDDWAEGVGRAWANTLNRIRPIQAIVYMGSTANSFMPIERVQDGIRQTMRRICMFPEHRSPDFPILKATEESRALYGAVIVWDRVQKQRPD